MLGYIMLPVLLFCLYACGNTRQTKSEEPAPSGPAPAASDDLVSASCGRCHNGATHPVKIQTAAQLKGNAKAKKRIEAGTMPPSGGLKPEVKASLLSVYEG